MFLLAAFLGAVLLPSLFGGCAGSRSTSLNALDTLRFVYLHKDIFDFPDHRAWRNSPSVVSEMGYLDLGIRQADYWSEEVGAPYFERLKEISAAADSLGPARLAGLGQGKLIVILEGNWTGIPPKNTTLETVVSNTLGYMMSNPKLGHVHAFKHVREKRHEFKAVYFDPGRNAYFDTICYYSDLAPRKGQPYLNDKEPIAPQHFKVLIERLSARISSK